MADAGINEMVQVTGVNVFPVDLVAAHRIIMGHVFKKTGGYVCFLNIDVCVQCYRDKTIRDCVNKAIANFADGTGVEWMLKLLGYRFKWKVRSADLLLKICESAVEHKLKIFLYGNTKKVLGLVSEKLKSRFAGLDIVGTYAPPFRELTYEEEKEVIGILKEKNPDVIFVSLGAPKQEKWMAKMKDNISGIQLGLGANFDFIAGTVKEAPKWMQRIGLEWLYRLPQQPRKGIHRMLEIPEFVLEFCRYCIKR